MMGYYCYCLPPVVVVVFTLISYSSLPIFTHSLATPPTPKTKPNSWQNRISKALLDVDGARSPQSRFRLLQRAVQDPSFSQDIKRGINAVQEKGMGKGHPILIDALWPKGTLARDDIEGIQGLVKSIPERFEEVKAEQNAKTTLFDQEDDNSNLDLNFGLYQRMIQKEENQKQSLNIIQNSFRRVPKDVPTLAWSPVTSFKAAVNNNNNNITVDIQQIQACRMMTTPLDSKTDGFTLKNMGRGLVRLSNYVLEQTEDVGMISSPFVVKGSNMYMFMNEEFDNRDRDVDVDMDPSDGLVTIEQWESRTLALLEFSGICTNGEIERQKNKLMEALTFALESKESDADDDDIDRDSDSPSDANSLSKNNNWENGTWKIADDDVFIFQYNAPGTLPWRRRNQVGFLVEGITSATIAGAVTETAAAQESTDDDHSSLDMDSDAGANTNTNTNTNTIAFLPDGTAGVDGDQSVNNNEDENENLEEGNKD